MGGVSCFLALSCCYCEVVTHYGGGGGEAPRGGPGEKRPGPLIKGNLAGGEEIRPGKRRRWGSEVGRPARGGGVEEGGRGEYRSRHQLGHFVISDIFPSATLQKPARLVCGPG